MDYSLLQSKAVQCLVVPNICSKGTFFIERKMHLHHIHLRSKNKSRFVKIRAHATAETFIKRIRLKYLRVHIFPSPVYPSLHVHM